MVSRLIVVFAQGIQGDDRIRIVPLRGVVSAFDLLDDSVRAQWAKQFRIDSKFVMLRGERARQVGGIAPRRGLGDAWLSAPR